MLQVFTLALMGVQGPTELVPWKMGMDIDICYITNQNTGFPVSCPPSQYILPDVFLSQSLRPPSLSSIMF